MEEGSNKREGLPPQLLDLIPDEKEWKLREALGLGRSRNAGFDGEEDKKLDLKLGLPGFIEDDEAETLRDYRLQQESPSLSLSFFPKHSKTTSSTTTTTGAKRGFIDTVEDKTEGYNDQKQQARAGCGKELAVEEMIAAVSERKKGCCPPPPPPHGAPATPARNRPQTQGRGAAAPVVGWPPIRSFRRNLASSSSSKHSPEPQNDNANAKVTLTCKKNPLVKINMDGIPIGRKIDLAAYNSYDGLSSAVKQLFHGFLQAQKDQTNAQIAQQGADDKIFYQLLDGSGEYTLVYEDSEGDRMLVGDVPWKVFVSTAKRLRVLRSSELSHTLVRQARPLKVVSKSLV
ncbi:auxin-responsive protein IAA6 isoform X1 [Oryza sativa Japonica Group]|uniref:auxin-responsive protein IAA6 isoform 1 n=1 Tax=Oryza sativa subsp. japonica TaxID=39947 RepID=UPI0001C7EDE1|nr:auxin-responsive protein IAA6 isoform 1 [Oryza sativa Japonica Group]XP_015619904.1 auxin-responsive protein IAA6 isoform X1 [Oryza sativa Japonica Group]XP_015619914.1 auxin-responsive protein IAA6 isoform X1 [Oryza sativa Japonica Group]